MCKIGPKITNKQQWRHITLLLYSLYHVNLNLDSLCIWIGTRLIEYPKVKQLRAVWWRIRCTGLTGRKKPYSRWTNSPTSILTLKCQMSSFSCTRRWICMSITGLNSPSVSLHHRLIKYSLDNLRPIRTAEAFEAVDWLHQQTWLHCGIA